jgi:hypothetical protein
MKCWIYVICVCLRIVVSNVYWLYEYHGECLVVGRDCLSFAGDWVHRQFLGGVLVAHLFSFMCCVFRFVCLCPVSCGPNVASFSELFISDCPFVFSNVYWNIKRILMHVPDLVKKRVLTKRKLDYHDNLYSVYTCIISKLLINKYKQN